jgi:hypothetical protein
MTAPLPAAVLRASGDILGCTLGAQDGTIGTVTDFYIDDEVWVIRYLIVSTADGTPDRKVLIMPAVLGTPDWAGKVLPVTITREQVRGSPDIDTDKPVSRQQEMGYLGYYGYGKYWGGGGLFGAAAYPDILQAGLQPRPAVHGGQGSDDPHLRSGNVLLRYYIHAADGDIGHVDGFIVDDRSWAIRYLVVQTSNWWPGNRVLVAPETIDAVSWADCMISLDTTRDAVREAPPYDASQPIGVEPDLYRHASRDSHAL